MARKPAPRKTHEDIERDMADFLARGGKVKKFKLGQIRAKRLKLTRDQRHSMEMAKEDEE